MDAQTFIASWQDRPGNEIQTCQTFLIELSELLGVPRPGSEPDYGFEQQVVVSDDLGNRSTDRIDLYRKDAFVLEAKKANFARDGAAWDRLMRGAFNQAWKYAHFLPEGRPPFLLTCDIGHSLHVWSGFSGDYGGYGSRRSILLADLAKPDVRDFLRAVFLDPRSLDPARHAAAVTREVAAHLGHLARVLRAAGHAPERVARFLMSCLFTMFAEDVGLLPKRLFTTAIRERWLPDPARFPHEVAGLWKAMDAGLPFGYEARLLRFNGGLFRNPDLSVLPLDADALALLLTAADRDWGSVEPAIFGTLLEEALDPVERQEYGAHFTPREYIERLVRPAVIDPLRADWAICLAEARQQVDRPDGAEPSRADRRRAIDLIRAFHARLCGVRVLDPACGSGNFLYVGLDLLKGLEREVLAELRDLGESQESFEGLAGLKVHPSQFLGIERNPQAREIAELVLWIGWLQWHRRTYGDAPPSEPVLMACDNLVHRDAVLEPGGWRPRFLPDGRPATVWDMRTYRKNPVTGLDVPDEDARVAVEDAVDPRPAQWPDADFVVSNPPFVGNKVMRKALGDGYTEALRRAWPAVDGSADLVMYWWEKAASLVREGRLRRFGFITTNSITQAFNRKVLERHLAADRDPVAIAWAIPDHPWVEHGAAVRIAMTVGCRADALSGLPVLGRVVREEETGGPDAGALRVDVEYRTVPRIHADLSGGANVAAAVPLRANQGLSYQGMNLVGQGFRISREEVRALGFDPDDLPGVIRPYMNARELMQTGEDRFVIDLFGMTADEARAKYPALYQWLFERVKPERDMNKRDSRRRNWWLFGEPVGKLREALRGLSRFIITAKTARNRLFCFHSTELIPDSKLYAFATDDAYPLGILSSRFHVAWADAAGGWLGVGNDATYNNTSCFDPFPFPETDDPRKARIRALGEALDAHRKAVQAAHPDVTLTGMYNGLERYRQALRDGGPAFSDRERDFHERARIAVLASIHDDLDREVAAAYGWPVDLPDDEVLVRLVDLNAVRAREEAAGTIRWLRPAFQAPATPAPVQQGLDAEVPAAGTSPEAPRPWPRGTRDQLAAVRDAVAAARSARTAAEVAALFTGAGTAAVRRHLETLEAVSALVAIDDGNVRRFAVRL